MLLYGAGGHAKVIIECLREIHQPVYGIFDDFAEIKSLGNIPVFGKYNPCYYANKALLLSIGDNYTRQQLYSSIRHKFGKVIHHSAQVAESAIIDSGSVVLHGTFIQTHASIGKQTVINTASVVEHDCIVGDFAHIAPRAVLCGGVQVGEGTLVGAGAVVNPNVKIGKWCVIGSGAVVNDDIPDFSVATGIPARVIQKNELKGKVYAAESLAD